MIELLESQKKYMLIKENMITNGRFVTSGAILWPGSPIPILDRRTWEAVGSLTTIVREDNIIYGISEDFSEDVDLGIEITHILSEKINGLLYITSGILRSCVVEEK